MSEIPKKQAYLGIWDLRPRGRIVERQTKVDFHNIRKYQTMQAGNIRRGRTVERQDKSWFPQYRKIFKQAIIGGVWKCVKRQKKNRNDLGDLDWLCDLGVNEACQPCPFLLMTWIWWESSIIKAVKVQFQSLTLNVHYLTLRAKIQNSAAFRFCVWSLRTFLCVFSTLLWKL